LDLENLYWSRTKKRMLSMQLSWQDYQ
jgi:hypothetical protein